MSVTFSTDIGQTLGGYQILETSQLPLPPNHREDARRIVRHGLRDVLEWLGEEVGPLPGYPTHCITTDRCMFVSAELAEKIRRYNRLTGADS